MSVTQSSGRRPKGEIVQGLSTKSSKIRALHEAGYERTEIRDYLGISYQHVRNVLTTPLAKPGEGGNRKHLSDGQRRQMNELVRELPTKSAKIRALDAAGYARGDIGRFLGIRYQHVRNVLVAPGPSHESTGDAAVAAAPPDEPAASQDHGTTANSKDDAPRAVWAKLGPDGEIRIPKSFREVLALSPGDDVILRREGEVLQVASRDAAIRQARKIARRFVPEGVSLVDELIADRRAEAARENRGD